MCGIIGMVGTRQAAPILLDALQRLEYRGYDSAGIATVANGNVERRRAAGKLFNLANLLSDQPLLGLTGIGHTRWASHGAPTMNNAHPHATDRVAVVHNGIIENHSTIRLELEREGQIFHTETDTEIVAQLIDLHLKRGMSPAMAASVAFKRLEGAYALAIVFASHPEMIIGTQHGAPLAVGFCDTEMFLGSDSLALAPLTNRVAFLETGDWVVVHRQYAEFRDAHDSQVDREIRTSSATSAAAGKDGYRHFMEKELHEHPAAISHSLSQMLDASRQVIVPAIPFSFSELTQITISACGSAFYAGLIGRNWMESIAKLVAYADVASELRYRDPPMAAGGLALLVSQSGETADTMAALRLLKSRHQYIASVVNVHESTMARESDVIFDTIAGPEIGVASTKAFTAQLTVLACIAIFAGSARGHIDRFEEMRLTTVLLNLSDQVQAILAKWDDIGRIAHRVVGARDAFYIASGSLLPIALEGALKLKEITYIHAEACSLNELKYGSIALVDHNVPIIAICPSGPLLQTMVNSLSELKGRARAICVFTDQVGAGKFLDVATEIFILPNCDPFSSPILYTVPVQILAYQVAMLLGTDVDQPRNLAKSVTVE